MRGTHHPRGAVHGRAEEVVTLLDQRSCVDAHASPELTARWPGGCAETELGLDGRARGRVDAREHGGHTVAKVLEDAAAVALYRGPDDLVVPSERGGHVRAVQLPPTSRTLDIGEEQRAHRPRPGGHIT